MHDVSVDSLPKICVLRYQAEPLKGYGGTIRGVLQSILAGTDWRTASAQADGGEGSMGNGGAMRAPVLGAHFADDLSMVIEEAGRSAAVTHAHPDGQAGAIAVAVAAALAWRRG
jgi:ADP-ribosylglycohydrolase